MEHQIEDERYQKEQARKESLEWKTVFFGIFQLLFNKNSTI